MCAAHASWCARQAPGRLFLVLEFCDAGDLCTWLRRHGAAPEPTAAHFLRHLAAGLRALRRLNVVHRDLKPQNLLLCAAPPPATLPTLKIADFGFARALATEAALADTLCGSPLYMVRAQLSSPARGLLYCASAVAHARATPT